jgi:probable selenium-dependent hydroxylase accessory protein YqeC
MLISEALDLKNKAFISLVGAGGKSSLFFLLAWELSKQKKRMILTTTTHMFTWQVTPLIIGGRLVETTDEKIMEESIKRCFYQDKNRTIILIDHRFIEQEEEKISGPKPNYLDFWWKEGLAEYFLVEADGARGKSVKGPAFHEPVIPETTTDLIGVVGIDAVGLTLEEEHVFRPHIFSRLTGLEWGEKISVDVIASLVHHPHGLFKNSPVSARKHLFINKINNEKKAEIAEELATKVLQDNQAKISDIMIGNTFHENCPVYKVIKD